MDALSLDYMLPEYRDKRQEVAREVTELRHENPPPQAEEDDDRKDISSSSRDFSNDTTVTVSDNFLSNVPDSGLATREENTAPANKNSTSSTSSADSIDNFNKYSATSLTSTSLYQAGFTAPTISYERDNELQKLVAVIGREFDRPHDIALSLQKLVSKLTNSDVCVAKFVPFTLKRKILLRGIFDTHELRRHDLICMCYNASEARILLTGADGFYSSLLKHVEGSLGPNKVSFLISNYTASSDQTQTDDLQLISPSLKTRLYHQEPLQSYVDENHVMSWTDHPNTLQASRLVELANNKLNPQSVLMNEYCSLL